MDKRISSARVLSLFIKRLGIPVTRQSVEEEIAKHPTFQGLLAISDALDSWDVPHAAYNLSFEELISTGVKAPFIALIRTGEKMTGLSLVESFHEKLVIISTDRLTKHQLNIDEFKELYSGTILLAEKDEDCGEEDYAEKKSGGVGR